uniref:Uncharacterized protein n=1 Tax=Salmonella sp. TaxID=599 RepID=A0A482ETB5_SALSP|nr:hypothetical protein NNIBIDOC_00119 [Salmonella sp.]
MRRQLAGLVASNTKKVNKPTEPTPNKTVDFKEGHGNLLRKLAQYEDYLSAKMMLAARAWKVLPPTITKVARIIICSAIGRYGTRDTSRYRPTKMGAVRA